ncbi:rop guanine nucleotide exchange factor 7-like [Iris pallida]|uniref:Rop guanine nucleotide exchange factor 7-like n=1 Tax=Iris pallida TaxID=29817 RepID=A0AAX6EHA1_IRIPA|nr:rop guanine nucleotide exchange factor 7-like [Iris pallida]
MVRTTGKRGSGRREDLHLDDGILVLPTVLGPLPKLNAKELLSDEYQTRILCLTAVVCVSGCCQVTIPLGIHKKTPVSVSFSARHGGDHFLLDIVNTMDASLQEQVDIAMKSNISRSSISKEESAKIAKEVTYISSFSLVGNTSVLC